MRSLCYESLSVLIHIEIRTNYHDNKHFALRLALKGRFRGTRKWSMTGDGIASEINMPVSIFRASARGVYISSHLITYIHT